MQSQNWWLVNRCFVLFQRGLFQGPCSLYGYELWAVLLLGIQSQHRTGWWLKKAAWGVGCFLLKFHLKGSNCDRRWRINAIYQCFLNNTGQLRVLLCLVCSIRASAIVRVMALPFYFIWEPGEDLRPQVPLNDYVWFGIGSVDAQKDFCAVSLANGGKARQNEMKLMSRSGHDEYWWSTLQGIDIAWGHFGKRKAMFNLEKILVKGHISSWECMLKLWNKRLQ